MLTSQCVYALEFKISRCLQICENIKSRKKKIEFLSRFDLVDTNFIYT